MRRQLQAKPIRPPVSPSRSCWEVLLVVSGPAVRADDLCGATIVEDVKLHHDLTCAGAGLIVGADGISINLNGHTIAGSGTDVGINVTGRTDVSIRGGTIRAFAVGVRVNTSSDLVIMHNEFVENGEGIDLQSGSVANTIKQNVFRDHTTRAVMLRTDSGDNDIKHNTFTGNRVGILVFGGVDNILKQNIVSGSTWRASASTSSRRETSSRTTWLCRMSPASSFS